MFTGLILEFYEDHPEDTRKGSPVLGRLISSVEDNSLSSATETVPIPGNCQYVVVSSEKDIFVEIDKDSADVGSARRQFIKAGTREKALTVGPVDNIIGYRLAGTVSSDLALTAFGELRTAQMYPLVQVDFPYNINTNIVSTSTTGSGTVTQSNSKAVVQTTAASSSSAKLETIRVVKYKPGQGCVVRFTGIFTTGVANSTQLIGIGDDEDGLFFGYNGATFGILRRQNSTDNWISSWNRDAADGSGALPAIDFTKGNVFEINFQWLGFGSIDFCIEHPETGLFTTVHRIEYANTATDPSIFNPSLPIMIEAENTTNATNIKIECASMAGFIEGEYVLSGPRQSISNTKTGVGSTQTNILTIRSKATFASKTNRIPVFVQFMTVSADGTKPVEIQITKNTTLGGSPSYTDVDTNTSVIEFDTAGTTISGGERLFTIQLDKTDSKDRNLVGAEVELVPGETLTFSGAASSATSDIAAACAWIEEF